MITEAPNRRFLFTVLTPTYNRAHTLARVYESLVLQTCVDFEWLIIDDGSTDSTRQLVETWQAGAPFLIRYVWQPNGHKKVALNHGFRLSQGEFIVVLDSDDELLPKGLSLFRGAWNAIPDDKRHDYCGVRALCIDEAGKIVGDRFPTDHFDATTSELLFKYGIRGEKLSCDKTEILRLFPFPEDVKGYVPEHILWTQISQNYKCRCINEPVRRYYDCDDSISNQLITGDVSSGIEGLVYAYNVALQSDAGWFWRSPKMLIKTAANRTRFLAHLRHGGFGRSFPIIGKGGRLLHLCFGWIGQFLYLRDWLRKRAAGRTMKL